MLIHVLGSGAGENYPNPWCSCPNCSYAREHGGKNLRGNSAVLLNDNLMIDMTESSLRNAVREKWSLQTVRYLLVTHAHTDHFAPNELWKRMFPKEYAGLPIEELVNRRGAPCTTPRENLHIYGTRHVKEALEGAVDLNGNLQDYGFDFNTLHGGETFTVADYTVTSVSSLHGEEGYTLNYILRQGGKTLLYALDTGGYDDRALHEITQYRYDAIILEATHGLMDSGEHPGHYCLETAKGFFASLRQNGNINDHSRLILSHLSPHWTPPHDLLVPLLEKEGITVAYDGQLIRL